MFGFLFSWHLFMNVSSVKFCNKYVWEEPKGYALVNDEAWCRLLSVFILIVTVFVQFFVTDHK